MIVKRIVAEILSFLSAVLITVFAAGILFGATANIFWPVFFLGGFVFYLFARSWMYDVFEINVKRGR